MNEEPHLINIMEFSIEGFAQIAGQILTENNIPYVIKKDILSSAYGIGGGGFGSRFRIFVPVEYSDSASELLQNLREDSK